MRVTIAIPTFNRADSLADTLRSLSRLQIPSSVLCQVLVVDNGSTDHTARVAREAASSLPFVVRHVVEQKQGLCYGRNRALDETSDEHVVFFDDDVIVSSRWLNGYVEAVDRGADCVVGPVVPVFPEPLPPYATPYVLSLLGSNYSRKGDQPQEVPSTLSGEVPGCNFGVRRDIALDIGGFDTTLDRIGTSLLAGGDSEFGIRLGVAGRRIVYEPECAIEHLIDPRKLERAQLRRRADGLGRTAARLRAKHRGVPSVSEWSASVKRATGLWTRWRYRQLTATPANAFEWELRTRRHLEELRESWRSRPVGGRN